MWPHALAGAAGANLENCRRVFSALTEQLMPVRLGPRAESVLFTDLDDAAQSDIGRPIRSSASIAHSSAAYDAKSEGTQT